MRDFLKNIHSLSNSDLDKVILFAKCLLLIEQAASQLNNITSQSYSQHLITINGEIISVNGDFMLDNKH